MRKKKADDYPIFVSICKDCGMLLLVSERFWNNNNRDSMILNDKGDWVPTDERLTDEATEYGLADMVCFGCPSCLAREDDIDSVVVDRKYQFKDIKRILALWNRLKENDEDNNYLFGIPLENKEIQQLLVEILI